jgi:hypothetical protein
MRQVHVHAVDMVGHEGAARAPFLPSRTQHEVLHQQLAPPFEQLGERALSFESVEDIVLLDANPWQRAALASDLVVQARQLLFVRQESPALRNP